MQKAFRLERAALIKICISGAAEPNCFRRRQLKKAHTHPPEDALFCTYFCTYAILYINLLKHKDHLTSAEIFCAFCVYKIYLKTK